MALFARRFVDAVRVLEKPFWLVSTTTQCSVMQNLDRASFFLVVAFI